MKPSLLKIFLTTLAVFCLVAPAAVTARNDDDHDHDRGRQFFVDDDLKQCPNAQFTSIQAAVMSASPGDTINVCPGTYREQVAINKPLTVRGISVANQNLALIMPAAVTTNSTSLAPTGPAPIAAIILVDSAKDVNLSNLTVDGGSNATAGCAPEFVGVYYRNSSGKVASLAVRNIRLGAGAAGCQSGIGIFVQSGLGRKSLVEIADSSVHDYQKNGITANESGTFISVHNNSVAGIGSTNSIAQNGIQIGFGAAGVVDSNTVIDNLYGLCTLSACPDTFATNILVIQSDGVKVSRNNTGNSQVNIDYEANRGEVSDNTVFESKVFDGVALIGNSNRACGNTIFDSEESGVFVQGNRNEVTDNTINEAPVGVLEASGTGNRISDNRFFNTGLNVSRASSAGGASTNSLSTVGPLSPVAQARSAQPARP